ESFAVEEKAPRSVIVVEIDEIYFQCARAIIRSELWNPQRHVDTNALPTPGEVLAAMTENQVGGTDYDKAWPERARQTMWRDKDCSIPRTPPPPAAPPARPRAEFPRSEAVQ